MTPEQFIIAGKQLFGRNAKGFGWQTTMSRTTDTPIRTIQAWAKGDNPIPGIVAWAMKEKTND